ncbi:MAG: hypothetical protein Q4P29_05615 [Tissierellia bacterium]|nr:hypothetical protein [Tissierellia bacterium]
MAIIFYIAIFVLFLYDYRQRPKNFKLKFIPLLILSAFGNSKFFQTLDDRIKMFATAIALLISIYLIYQVYRDYKVEKYRMKKKLRDERYYQNLRDNVEYIEDDLIIENRTAKTENHNHEHSNDKEKIESNEERINLDTKLNTKDKEQEA